MPYLQRCLTKFLKRFFAERGWGWLLWFKILSAQIFWFCNSNVTTFPTSRNCKNFNFPLYTVPAEMLYLQKYFTNFHKLFFGKRRWRSLLWFKISSAQIFWFCNSNVNTFKTSRKCWNFNFSLYTVPAEMHYLQKYLTNFQKLFCAERRGRWQLWLKIEVHRYFGSAIATLQLFQHPENVKLWIFPFTQSQQKCYISRSI